MFSPLGDNYHEHNLLGNSTVVLSNQQRLPHMSCHTVPLCAGLAGAKEGEKGRTLPAPLALWRMVPNRAPGDSTSTDDTCTTHS